MLLLPFRKTADGYPAGGRGNRGKDPE